MTPTFIFRLVKGHVQQGAHITSHDRQEEIHREWIERHYLSACGT